MQKEKRALCRINIKSTVCLRTIFIHKCHYEVSFSKEIISSLVFLTQATPGVITCQLEWTNTTLKSALIVLFRYEVSANCSLIIYYYLFKEKLLFTTPDNKQLIKHWKFVSLEICCAIKSIVGHGYVIHYRFFITNTTMNYFYDDIILFLRYFIQTFLNRVSITINFEILVHRRRCFVHFFAQILYSPLKYRSIYKQFILIK